MIDRKLMKNFDWPIVLIVYFLFSIGLVAISSATKDYGYYYVTSQLLWIAMGTVAAIVVLFIDYNTLGSGYLYLYGIMVALLIAVLAMGEVINGSKSWFGIGNRGIQPSEIGKVLFILTLSKFIEQLHEQDPNAINHPKNLVKLFIIMAVPVLLIAKQGDNGTALVFVAIFLVLLFAGGISYQYVLAAFGGCIAFIPVFYFVVFPRLEPYVQDRFRVFFNPYYDPLDAGYHAIRSQIAIGSGRLFGEGLYQGMQTQMQTLPESHTDFIFSVIGEEMGFVTCALVVILYTVLFYRCLRLARTARDYYGSLIVTGITAMISVHTFQNIMMTVGLMPITGIPLPFLSYGGSSTITNLIGMGLVLNVGMRRQKINF